MILGNCSASGAKMQAIANGTDIGNTGNIPTNPESLQLPVGEHFDALEMNGLLQLSAELNNPWLERDIFPLLAELNNLNPCVYLEETAALKQRVRLISLSRQATIDANDFTEGNFVYTGSQSISFDLAQGVSDLVGLYKQSLLNCANAEDGDLDNQLSLCRREGFTAAECAARVGYSQQAYPVMRRGEYVVKASYILPGDKLRTTKKLIFSK